MRRKLFIVLCCSFMLTGCNITINGEQVLDVKEDQIEQWKDDADKMLEGLKDANALLEENPNWENMPDKEKLDLLKNYASKVNEVLPSN